MTDEELTRTALLEYAGMLERRARSRSYTGSLHAPDRLEWRRQAKRLREMALWHGLVKPGVSINSIRNKELFVPFADED